MERSRSTPEPSLPAPEPCEGCWLPPPGTTWQWQLHGTIDTSFDVDMYDVDGFDVPRRTVERLHDDGRAVVCYLSAGSWERWRPDADRFPDRVLGRSNGWPGERWLDIRKMRVLKPIMRDRIAMCADKGFDGVELDNVDAYTNRTGFPINAQDQLRYNVWLANEAHDRGLSVALKNAPGLVDELLPYFDFAVVEQCFQFRECDRYSPFVADGKAVFEVEYKLDLQEFCPKARALGFSAMRKRLDLGVWRQPC